MPNGLAMSRKGVRRGCRPAFPKAPSERDATDYLPRAPEIPPHVALPERGGWGTGLDGHQAGDTQGLRRRCAGQRQSWGKAR